MALVLALVPDLLFGSRVRASLQGAGHEVLLLGGEQQLCERLAEPGAASAGLLIVDLTDPQLDGARVLESLRASAAHAHTRTLAFYSHVDAEARRRAELAGFELVVPRSRLAREAPELAGRLLAA